MADFGPWARVVDPDSARQAVRMAGLPVFLIGLITVLTIGALTLFVAALGLAIAAPLPMAIAGVAGLALVATGLALRAGNTALAPLAACLTLANSVWVAMALPLWVLPLQALMALVAVSGLRGWWWQRKNRP